MSSIKSTSLKFSGIVSLIVNNANKHDWHINSISLLQTLLQRTENPKSKQKSVNYATLDSKERQNTTEMCKFIAGKPL